MNCIKIIDNAVIQDFQLQDLWSDEDEELLEELEEKIQSFVDTYLLKTIHLETETWEDVVCENVQISRIRDSDLYHALIGGDWQEPVIIIFAYENQQIKPKLIYQNF